ncbi:MAG TPA: molybdopterin converting factor subunit 1 [Thiolapillus brandeum]|uniref:Molybdopterin synthase sulfur carrier subunit n=1 Tax=Thiolapillus brandeum TaxID=1076588 RepID=A0A7C5N0I2_9GAMM|nr:molybdopterin converting factor subunit 1 [Thiolapillus brandeum]
MIRLLYFASLRDRLGVEREELALPEEVKNVAALRCYLAARGAPWNRVFDEEETVLAAVNQEMAQDDTPVRDGDEVGFFPPVTGG